MRRSTSWIRGSMVTMGALAILASVSPQAAQDEDVWNAFRFFLGRWEGRGEGQGGVSKGRQEWALILRDRYLEVSNLAVFDPQEKNATGERHEDRGIISYDRSRRAYVFRQFHVEGFVNQYICAASCPAGKSFVFVSEAIENIAPGFKARVTYEIIGDDQFRQTFDLAEPGKDFVCYSQGVMTRAR